ncbi:MAG: hypothetical protein Q8Q89_02895 [bacterium]|nr:hypothetical protein [bacterium]
MSNQDLQQYIQQSRQAGKTDPRYAEGSGEASDQIRQEFLGAGWKGFCYGFLPQNLI